MNVYGRTRDLVVIGWGQNELEDLARPIVQKQGRQMRPDPEPEKGFYYRSDHFSFAKKGVPAFYAEGERNISANRRGMDARCAIGIRPSVTIGHRMSSIPPGI